MTDYWKPQARARKCSALAELMESAATALHREDRRIAGFVDAARADSEACSRPHAARNVGRGLSYWLYETTFVYLVWREWMRTGQPAALDWTAAALEGAPARQGVLRGMSYDLVVFSSPRRRALVFEAKRWTYTPSAMAAALTKDADKLRAMQNSIPRVMNAQKYILLFACEVMPGDGDAGLARFCQDASLGVAGCARFPATFWRNRTERRGSFVIHALEVLEA
jgi:hypothetical protein